MAIQLSTALRNAILDLIESTIGTSARVKFFDGSLPANVAAADNGTVVADFSLPSNWMADAASGQKVKAGTWEDTSANATGTPDYFRVYQSDGTTCHMQGTLTATGGGGDMTIDNTNVASGQAITITGFTLTAPGA